MKRCLSYILAFILFTSCNSSDDATQQQEQLPETSFFIKGVDASSIPQVRQSGIEMLNTAGHSEDMLTTLKNAGVNTIRIRLWKNPEDNHSSFQEVKAFASEVKSMGMKVWLTVHYSDTWADPGSQTKPVVWQDLDFATLQQEVYNYTAQIVTEIQPDYIQIGNEINSGFLFPEGNITNLSQFTTLLSKGISAVRDTSEDCKIILHYAGYEGAQSFYSELIELDYDIIGLSYYPVWHGKDLTEFQNNITTLANQYNKEIVIAETAYPFTLDWNDYTNNIIGSEDQLLPQYTPTATGQKEYLQKIKQIIAQESKGIGFCYWGAELVAFNGPTATDGSATENLAFWDFNNTALPVLEVYQD
ncbi:arabinogalactan endo-1,4-beta-galactosidase [Flavobacterium arcticum]|uniref:Arabinogalactan endo-beta-1,4-galactanase n=1 Tax=Flavobacterium arcticum TaxID=1784713 RepID=A0A345HF99_9FLAO|nr:glycosyl hydrolase 53 family protein [Flavobacterium arcticum]AXG75259.1 arabinogalactan endo-1,4-beta-galactosidase [Flavobacterium arcticum]KAF2508173.1 arabinogalactan endo-1,4-beta-galactosidase [Flavobacterium arcticum]